MANSSLKKRLIKMVDDFELHKIERYWTRSRIRILMYHRFCHSPSPFKVNKDVFNEQMNHLKTYYNVIALDELCDRIRNGIRLPVNPVVLTIDDGYADCYEIAFPILKKYGLNATVFLTANFIEERSWLWSNRIEYILSNSCLKQFEIGMSGKNSQFDVSSLSSKHSAQLAIYDYCRRLPNNIKDEFIENLSLLLKVSVPEKATEEFEPLSWEQIREMGKSGISFGSHTKSHPILSQIDGHQAEEEIGDSKRIIEEQLSREVLTFCYPNGQEEDFNEKSISIIQKNGYQCAVTAIPGTNNSRRDLFRLKRIGDVGSFSPYFRRKIALG